MRLRFMVILMFVCLVPYYAAAADEPTVQLGTVSVEGNAVSGSAANGYAVDNTSSIGVWGQRKKLDTPYSSFTVSDDLMNNAMTANPNEVYRLNPLVYGGGSYQLNASAYFYARGFDSISTYINGVQNNNFSMGHSLEDMESVEVMNGFSGFFYGVSPSGLGGLAMYNSKRPTQYYLNSITAGDYGNEQFYIHGDFGGQVPGGLLGYRFNVVKQSGETSVESQTLERFLISGAVDVYINAGTLLQFNATHSNFDRKNGQSTFSIRDDTLTRVPDPLDPKKLWGPKGTYIEVTSDTFGADFKSKLTDRMGLRAAFNHTEDLRQQIYTGGNSFVNNSEEYSFTLYGGKWKYVNTGGYLYFDFDADTFGIKHTLTAGLNGSTRSNYAGIFDTQFGVLPVQIGPTYTVPISDSVPDVDVPYWDMDVNMGKQLESTNINMVLADDIQITDKWSVLGGINYVDLETKNYDAVTGAKTAKYHKYAPAPSVALMFKPVPAVSTYISYMEALEQGQTVGSTYQNAGEALQPMVSRQYELGAKAELGRMLLTAAIFQTDKANQYSDNGTTTGKYVQDGRQVHRGVEFSAQGKIINSLTVYGGGTYLDAKVEKTNNPNLEDKTPYYVPDYTAKLYLEYDTPFFKGFTLTGGVNYVGDRWANSLNTNKLPSYALFDLGARYTVAISKVDTTFAVNVTNLLDKRYWLDQPLGPGRNIAFSVNAEF